MRVTVKITIFFNFVISYVAPKISDNFGAK